MKAIWKYKLKIVEKQEITLPRNYTIMHVGLDPQGNPCLWAKVPVDTAYEQVRCTVYICGTGNPLPANLPPHIGTFIDGAYVWHVFAN